MRICSVYVMGFYNREEHVAIAANMIAAFQKIRTRPDEAYKAKLYLIDEETEEAVRFALERTDLPRPDYVVSIGTDLTVILKKLYKEIIPIPTMFINPIDPIGNGIIDSFERPGGWFSGIYSNMQPLQIYKGTQNMFKWMLPCFKKILIPYDVILSNTNHILTELEVQRIVAELERIGFEPILKRVSGDEEAARCVYDNVGRVDAVASFAVSELAERNMAYWCGMAEPKRFLISSNGDRGIKHGAALATRLEHESYAFEQVVAMVRKGWYERVWPGLQPVTRVSEADFGRVILLVNPFVLPSMPTQIMEAMRNTSEVVIQNYWPHHPMNSVIKEQQQKGLDESGDKDKE